MYARRDEPAVIDLEKLPPKITREKHLQSLPISSAGNSPMTNAGVGVIQAVTGTGSPLVEFPTMRGHAAIAQTTIPISFEDVGREVVLVFKDGDPQQPIIIGLIHAQHKAHGLEARVDGERIVFRAEKEITLSCGDASITLTRAGKVLIRGTYVASRSSGVNRLKGATVQIN